MLHESSELTRLPICLPENMIWQYDLRDVARVIGELSGYGLGFVYLTTGQFVTNSVQIAGNVFARKTIL
jgi:hypothetical protein